jgi:hypothetical protein
MSLIQQVPDAVSKLSSWCQDQHRASSDRTRPDSFLDEAGDTLDLVIHSLPLHDEHLALRISGTRLENPRSAVSIVRDQAVCQNHDTPWAPPAFLHGYVIRAGVRVGKLDNALGVRMLERINGLIFVAHNRCGAVLGQQVQESLFSTIQILIFVDQHVIKQLPFVARGILPKVPERFRHNLPY